MYQIYVAVLLYARIYINSIEMLTGKIKHIVKK